MEIEFDFSVWKLLLVVFILFYAKDIWRWIRKGGEVKPEDLQTDTKDPTSGESLWNKINW